MMKYIELKHAKIKYWINEMPRIMTPNILTSEEVVRVQRNQSSTHIKIALEIFLYKDASYYGLLGVEYYPELNADGLKVIINYTSKNDLEYKDAIIEYNEKVFMGLTEAYVSYLKKDIKEYINGSDRLQGGILNFTVAANSEVGSSPLIFSALSEMLVELVVKIKPEEADTNFDDLVKEVFYSSKLFCGRE